MYQAAPMTGLGADVNIIEAMEMFKDLSDTQIEQAKRNPAYALFANLEQNRRLKLRSKQADQAPKKTVAEQLSEATLGIMSPQRSAPAAPKPQGLPQAMPSGPQGMPEAMPQQTEPQGLAALMGQEPVQMASGGPVAFSNGLMVESEEEKAKRLERERIERELSEPYRPANPMAGQAARQEGYRETELESQRLAQRARDAQRQQVRNQEQAGLADLERRLRQQSGTSGQSAAPSFSRLLEAVPSGMRADAPQIMSTQDYETNVAKREEAQQKKFGDPVSPIAEQLAKLTGQTISPEEMQKRVARESALAMMAGKRRDFAGALSEGLMAGDKAKAALEETNRQRQVLGLQAQMANAKYKDSLARQNFADAEKYANELRELDFKQKQLNQNAAVLNANIIKDLAQAQAALRPPATAGAKPLTPAQLLPVYKEALSKAKPEIDALDKEFEGRTGIMASLFSGMSGKKPLPANWRQDPKAQWARDEYDSRRQQIINRHVSDLTGGMLGSIDLSDPNKLAQAMK
jgi:hypothetical protein